MLAVPVIVTVKDQGVACNPTVPHEIDYAKPLTHTGQQLQPCPHCGGRLSMYVRPNGSWYCCSCERKCVRRGIQHETDPFLLRALPDGDDPEVAAVVRRSDGRVAGRMMGRLLGIREKDARARTREYIGSVPWLRLQKGMPGPNGRADRILFAHDAVPGVIRDRARRYRSRARKQATRAAVVASRDAFAVASAITTRTVMNELSRGQTTMVEGAPKAPRTVQTAAADIPRGSPTVRSPGLPAIRRLKIPRRLLSRIPTMVGPQLGMPATNPVRRMAIRTAVRCDLRSIAARGNAAWLYLDAERRRHDLVSTLMAFPAPARAHLLADLHIDSEMPRFNDVLAAVVSKYGGVDGAMRYVVAVGATADGVT